MVSVTARSVIECTESVGGVIELVDLECVDRACY